MEKTKLEPDPKSIEIKPSLEKTHKKEKIDTLLKEIEQNSEQSVPRTSAYIIRLDGRAFSTFTEGFQKPFDFNFAQAMILTMNDLITEFLPTTGYSHSDEISLIFPPVENPLLQTHLFDGRILKICSVIASFCSVRFAFHLIRLVKIEEAKYDPKVLAKIYDIKAHFDARILIFQPPQFQLIVKHMIWRSIMDCKRNAISTYARHFYKQSEVQGKKSADLILKMKAEKGFDFYKDAPLHIQNGTYAKRQQYVIPAINQITLEAVEAVRTEILNKSFKIEDTEKSLEMLFAKYWN